MNEMKMLVDAIVECNKSDKMTMNKNTFINYKSIIDIIDAHDYTKDNINRLIMLANRLVKHSNNHLQKVEFTDLSFYNALFEILKTINEYKFENIINLIDKYCYSQKEKIPSEKVLKKYINTIINNNYIINKSLLGHIDVIGNEIVISESIVKKYNLFNMVNKQHLPWSYLMKTISQDDFNMIVCSCDVFLTVKQMDYINTKIINIKKYNRYNKLPYLINDMQKVLKSVDKIENAGKVMRIRYGDFDKYISEIYPMILYARERNDVIRIKHTGNMTFKSSHDGEFITTEGKELIEVTSVAYDEKEKNNMKVLNIKGIVSGDLRYEDTSQLVDDIFMAIIKKNNPNKYKEVTTLLIDGLNVFLFENDKMQSIIDELKKRINVTNVFNRIDLIVYNGNEKVCIYNIL